MSKFKDLNDRLLSSAQSYLSQWLPGGRVRGHEYVVGSLGGESGESLSINMQTGVWKDFATGQAGGDLVSLYAEIKNCKQGEAYKLLQGEAPTTKKTTTQELIKLMPPPKDLQLPSLNHRQHGKPSEVYKYCDTKGQLLFIITRHDLADGTKLIRPWSYDGHTKKWVKKHWPTPRPLYGLETLKDKVLLVEGEKAVHAARKHVSDKLSVLTWPGGASAVDRVDWSSIHGKSVLIWPDHDEPGRKAAAKIAEKLISKCPAIKIIDTTNDELPDGFDAADYDWSKPWSKWANERSKLISKPQVPAKVKPAKPPEPQLEMPKSMKNSQGNLICSAFNASLYLYGHTPLKGRVWLDSFFMDYMTDISPFGDGKTRESSPITNGLVLKARMILQRVPGFEKISKADAEDALKMMAETDVRNEPHDWLKSIEWDHTPRLDEWLIKYGGAPDNEYVRAVSKNMILAICKRIISPGAKFDHVPVLHAGQGAGKSQLLRVMAGRYFSELTSSIKRNGKDALLVFSSKLLVEISEGAALIGMSNDEKKAFITSEVDHYRAPYARATQSHPRTAIICITTNNFDILDDITGDRRYWPVKLGHCDYEGLKEVREQLFAEAFYRLQLEENYFEVPYEQAEHAREEFTSQDDIADDIVSYAESRASEYVRTKEVFQHVINDGSSDMKQFKQSQQYIASVLRRAGFVRTRVSLEGKQQWVFAKPGFNPMIQTQLTERSPVKNYAPQGIT